MNIEEYEKKYVKFENVRSIKVIVKVLVTFMVLVLLYIFFSLCAKAFSINIYVGVVVVLVCIMILIFCFVVPIYRIVYKGYFDVNVRKKYAVAAKKHNDETCIMIAKSIIDFDEEVEGDSWYDAGEVEDIKFALSVGDKNMLKEKLTNIMNGSIRKTSDKLIVRAAVKAGVYSAVSQTEIIDMLLILIVDIQMIKDLVFLFGFRPSTIKMYKIIKSVLFAVATAAGLQTTKAGKNVFDKIIELIRKGANVGAAGTAMTGNVPGAIALTITSGVLGVVVDSTVQGLANGTLTAIIGYQTIKYLNDEYKLQQILDNVDLLDDNKEFRQTYEEIKNELQKKDGEKNV